ncbi:MAG: LamG-like jellyroll fold domain-containing protein [bacterium]
MKAFTLIELLVVISIIGLLASIVLVGLEGATDRAQIGKSLAFTGHVRRSLGAYAVAVYNFNDGTVTDLSGNGNHGTRTGTTLVPSIPELGNALSFNGSTDYVSVPDSNSLDLTTAGTIEVWAKKDTQKNYQMYVTKGIASANTGYQLMDYGSTGRIVLRWGSDGNNIITDEVVPTGVWYHIVGTYDGSNLMIYLNGSLAKKVPYTTDAVANTDPLMIGRRSTATSYFFDGILDEVRIYNESLTLSEIQQLYAEGAARHGLVLNQQK